MYKSFGTLFIPSAVQQEGEIVDFEEVRMWGIVKRARKRAKLDDRRHICLLLTVYHESIRRIGLLLTCCSSINHVRVYRISINGINKNVCLVSCDA